MPRLVDFRKQTCLGWSIWPKQTCLGWSMFAFAGPRKPRRRASRAPCPCMSVGWSGAGPARKYRRKMRRRNVPILERSAHGPIANLGNMLPAPKQRAEGGARSPPLRLWRTTSDKPPNAEPAALPAELTRTSVQPPCGSGSKLVKRFRGTQPVRKMSMAAEAETTRDKPPPTHKYLSGRWCRGKSFAPQPIHTDAES